MRRLLESTKHSMRPRIDRFAGRIAPAPRPNSGTGHHSFTSIVPILRLVAVPIPPGDVQMTERPEIVIPSEPRPVGRVVARDEETDPFQASPDGRDTTTRSSVTLDAVKADPEVQAFIRNA